MLTFAHRDEIVIETSPDVVFKVLSDIERHVELAGSGEIKAIRAPADGTVAAGSTFEADEEIKMGRSVQALSARCEIVEYDPPRLLSWTSTPLSGMKPRRAQWWFRLTPEGSGTRLVNEVEVDFGPIGNVLMKLPYRVLRATTVRDGMRRTLENVSAAAGG